MFDPSERNRTRKTPLFILYRSAYISPLSRATLVSPSMTCHQVFVMWKLCWFNTLEKLVKWLIIIDSLPMEVLDLAFGWSNREARHQTNYFRNFSLEKRLKSVIKLSNLKKEARLLKRSIASGSRHGCLWEIAISTLPGSANGHCWL